MVYRDLTEKAFNASAGLFYVAMTFSTLNMFRPTINIFVKITVYMMFFPFMYGKNVGLADLVSKVTGTAILSYCGAMVEMIISIFSGSHCAFTL